jgi:hypothetical protein
MPVNGNMEENVKKKKTDNIIVIKPMNNRISNQLNMIRDW